ncbi:MAG TPA: hypothetical protein PLZ57_00635 [Pseudobdellovibrionaceae bacterium]|nr:hypothetical protein [Pseudobdellovibrionaceae bacterium]
MGQNRLQKGFSLQGAAGTYAEYQGEYIQVTPLLFNEDTNMGLSAFPKVLSEVRREIGSAYFYWNESEILAQLPRILASNRLPPAVGIRILEQRAWRGCQLESEDRFEITSENLHLFSKTNGIFRIPTPIPSRVCGSP